jgi:hypothetical protein
LTKNKQITREINDKVTTQLILIQLTLALAGVIGIDCIGFSQIKAANFG